MAGLLNLHSQRMYRLTSLNGDPHPVLDDVYESFDSAWTDASSWWQNHGHTEQEPIPIGVEVSTRSGSWRTLQYPCQQEGRAVLFPQRPIPTKRHKAWFLGQTTNPLFEQADHLRPGQVQWT